MFGYLSDLKDTPSNIELKEISDREKARIEGTEPKPSVLSWAWNKVKQ